MIKTKDRALKRDARLERRYGDKLLRKIADNETASGNVWVAQYYYQYRAKKQECFYDSIFAALFFLFGIFDLIMIFVKQDGAWSVSFALQGLFALHFLNCARMCTIEGDYLSDKLVFQASLESKRKALDFIKKSKKGDKK